MIPARAPSNAHTPVPGSTGYPLVVSRRLLITGSREWTDEVAIHGALLLHGPGEVVHGAARGADRIAGALADRLGWPVDAHPADWDRYGRAAGTMRNRRMVELGADVCLAFPLPGSRGTWDCVRRARAAGIGVVIHSTPRGRLWLLRQGTLRCGLRVEQGRVAEAAPPLAWAVQRSWPEIKAELIAQGWHGEPLPRPTAARRR